MFFSSARVPDAFSSCACKTQAAIIRNPPCYDPRGPSWGDFLLIPRCVLDVFSSFACVLHAFYSSVMAQAVSYWGDSSS